MFFFLREEENLEKVIFRFGKTYYFFGENFLFTWVNMKENTLFIACPIRMLLCWKI